MLYHIQIKQIVAHVHKFESDWLLEQAFTCINIVDIKPGLGT